MAKSWPTVLVILDGWGIGRDEPGNAVLAAHTPVMDGLVAHYPHATLRCSGEDVGLPVGQMGNSEVGHLNIGAGFVVNQWITRIDHAIENGTLASNPTLGTVFSHLTRTGGTLHLMGLVSDGGVHSHLRHLITLLQIAAHHGEIRIRVHAFTDGRDTSPTSASSFLTEVERTLAALHLGRIATVSGRYYAMDRDHRWERTKLAFDAIVQAQGVQAGSATEVVECAYASGLTDEFILPSIISNDEEKFRGINSGDAVIFFNFRADRARQLTEALSKPEFSAFPRKPALTDVFIATLTRYEAELPVAAIFAPVDVEWPLARAISAAGLCQLHCAETEKYAHVTFFINGGREEPFAGEERILIPSPYVATYDLKPEMSAAEVAVAVVQAIEGGDTGAVIVNFANADMVGHSGVFLAAVRAVETVDQCLGQIVTVTLAAGGVVLVSADHGNAEEMIDRVTGEPMTAHTTNPVPVVLVAAVTNPAHGATLRPDGNLSAVAPTLLELMDIDPPLDMTQVSLLVRPNEEVSH